MSTTGAAATEALGHDNADLEALFDSIASANRRRGSTSDQFESEEDVVAQVGHLTRHLHDALSKLSFDRLIKDAAGALPDTRDRLAYVVAMTEQAATRSLNATEEAKPLQDALSTDASRLAGEWDKLFKHELSVDEFKSLTMKTRAFLGTVPPTVPRTQALFNEIVMAQEFQDLTGQVIKQVTDVAQDIEGKLLDLLIAHAPQERRAAAESTGLLDGPVVNQTGRADIVTSQTQVDELLESLGF